MKTDSSVTFGYEYRAILDKPDELNRGWEFI